MSTDPKALSREIDDLKDRALGNLGRAMFLLLPAVSGVAVIGTLYALVLGVALTGLALWSLLG